MFRRTIILAALAVLLGMSSGDAIGGTKYIKMRIDFPVFDSTDVLTTDGGDVSSINDTLYFTFRPFSNDGPWTDLSIRFVTSTVDTSTATGLCRDSVRWYLQTKLEDDSAKWWHNVAKTAAIPFTSWDSTGSADTLTGQAKVYKRLVSAATGDIGWANSPAVGNTLEFVAADSIMAYGQLFRIMAEYHAEEDSLESHCILRSSSVISIMDVMTAHIMFHLR